MNTPLHPTSMEDAINQLKWVRSTIATHSNIIIGAETSNAISIVLNELAALRKTIAQNASCPCKEQTAIQELKQVCPDLDMIQLVQLVAKSTIEREEQYKTKVAELEKANDQLLKVALESQMKYDRFRTDIRTDIRKILDKT